MDNYCCLDIIVDVADRFDYTIVDLLISHLSVSRLFGSAKNSYVECNGVAEGAARPSHTHDG